MRWFRWLARARAERQTLRELQALDDHLLRDIGIERGDIPRVVASLFDGEPVGALGRATTFRTPPRAEAPAGSGSAARGRWRPSVEGLR